MGSSETLETGNEKNSLFYQNVIVMRHGDRLDNFDHHWLTQADRPWDPPLTDTGLEKAFSTGCKLRDELGFPITRVFVSPFLRCVQTASRAVAALATVEDAAKLASIDPSKIKVSIEYGLCEMLNHIAIMDPPKDENWGFDIPVLESMFPSGTLDSSMGKFYKELPKYGEKVEDTRARYKDVLLSIAGMYPSENVLLVTHGEGVGTSISAFKKGLTVCGVEYCAFSHVKRAVWMKEDGTFAFGDFEVLTESDGPGISYVNILQAASK